MVCIIAVCLSTLHAYASQFTSAIIPPILGHVFKLFTYKEEAYRSFFFTAAALHAVSVTLLFLVDPAAERQRQQREIAAGLSSSLAGGAGGGAGAESTAVATHALDADAGPSAAAHTYCYHHHQCHHHHHHHHHHPLY